METVLGDGQASLIEALQNQYKAIRDEIQVCGRNQKKAVIAEKTVARQLLTGVESIESQVQALMGLKKFRVGSVFV